MKYYSLKVKNNYGNLHIGENIFNAVKPLTIGQLNSANILLPCADDLLPQNFCTIKTSNKPGCWIIIKRTDFYTIQINDKELDCVLALKNGDIISMDGISFQFRTHEDDNYSEASGIILSKEKRNNRSLLFGIISLFLILFFSIGLSYFTKNHNIFTKSDDDMVHSSIYRIEVSEIKLLMHTGKNEKNAYDTVASYSLENTIIGTCFFTKDSLCVTARHCVEPWLEFSDWTDSTNMRNLPQEVNWAIKAEWSQLEQADTLYKVISLCKVMDGEKCIMLFNSDECSFNRSRDIIARMGSELLPWRIIYPLYNRVDVELGDFAFLKTKRAGNLTLATDNYLAELTENDDAEVRIYGFPQKNHGYLCEFQTSKIDHRDFNFKKECIQLNVNGAKGYSGSPVLEKKNGTITVIGIFSKVDDFDGNTFYAVPATEVSNYNFQKANEKKQHRR